MNASLARTLAPLSSRRPRRFSEIIDVRMNEQRRETAFVYRRDQYVDKLTDCHSTDNEKLNTGPA